MSESITPSFRAQIPTTLEMVAPLRRMLEGLLTGLGWSEDDAADVGLVATEVVQNAVEHGSLNDGRETVDFSCTLDGADILFDVADPGTGRGTPALLAQDVTKPPPVEASRGRGLYLVHRMARHMERSRGPRGGSLVRVRMRPTPA